MAKLKIPRGLYLQARLRKRDGALVFRWGHAPGLRARGIRPLDLFADGRPLTSDDLAAAGLPASTPLPSLNGRLLLHAGRSQPLPAAQAIEVARQLSQGLQTDTAAITLSSAAPKAAGAPPAKSAYTVGDLIEDFLNPRHWTASRGASEDTYRSYKSWRTPVDDVFREEPCAAMNEETIAEWFSLTRQIRGHRMAYGAYQLLRAAWNWAPARLNLRVIHWNKIRPEKPQAKLRIGSEDELVALLRATDQPRELAEEIGDIAEGEIPAARPELGDSLVLAIWTVQRARDVLSFTDATIRSGRFRFIASKNGTKMDIPIVGTILPARLEAMAKRRRDRQAITPQLVLDPDKDHPYVQKTHGKHFREARALAGKMLPSLLGEGIDDWGQPHKTFTFEDCRDTGITRLLRAGCSIEQVASWSNHKDVNALRALASSYMDLTGEVADAAGDNLAAYAEKKAFRL